MNTIQKKTTQTEHRSQSKSLEEVHSSVETQHPKLWKRIFAFAGPAYLVSVGYMDPGNWATDLEGGSRFGYALVWVILMSNMMAVLLQTLAARLGIVTGKDLAQACRSEYSEPASFALWILCEIAIAACDLAEVLGTILGLNLLFGLPLALGRAGNPVRYLPAAGHPEIGDPQDGGVHSVADHVSLPAVSWSTCFWPNRIGAQPAAGLAAFSARRVRSTSFSGSSGRP